jgi:hypothetical protein
MHYGGVARKRQDCRVRSNGLPSQAVLRLTGTQLESGLACQDQSGCVPPALFASATRISSLQLRSSATDSDDKITTTPPRPPLLPHTRHTKCLPKPAPKAKAKAAAPSRTWSRANTRSTCTSMYVQFDEVHRMVFCWRLLAPCSSSGCWQRHRTED